MSVAPPILEVRGACKRFGAVVALDEVSLYVARGEVLALLGDNGAGKSTLIKAISGVHRLDTGTVTLDGLDITAANAMTVRSHGVETVYQDKSLGDKQAMWRNFFIGREITYPEIALNDLKEVAESLSDVGIVEQAPMLEGRTMLMVLAPGKAPKKK